MALPSVAALSGNTNATKTHTGSPGTLAVKQEPPDEAEIREMAAKLVEANNAKMAVAAAAAARQTAQVAPNMVQPGQPGIMSYLTRTGGGAVVTVGKQQEKNATDAVKKPLLDEESLWGRFGWVTLGKCHIPYILRAGEKYCAVRMVENKLLNRYLCYLNAEVYECTCIPSYYITDSEAKLFNEINQKHCDGHFGREAFTTHDLVVRLQDAREFYHFLDVCYNKLVLSSSNPKDKCGFIRINGESVVPYTVREGLKYVPLFYFEGETDSLKLKAEKLEGWDLSYLKFCCKVQGIRSELFAHETCSVISLNDIRGYFPTNTLFEDYWPSKMVESQMLLATKGSSNNGTGGMWTKQPPPAKMAPTATQVRPAAPPQVSTAQPVCNGWSGLVGGQPTYQPSMVTQPAGPVIRTQHTPISMHSLNTTTSTTRSIGRARGGSHQFYPQVTMTMASQPSHMTAQPPPLVRVSGAPGIGNAHTYTTAATGMQPGSMHMMGTLTSAATSHQMPPPASYPQHSPHYSPMAQQRHTPPSNPSPASVASKYPPPLLPVLNGTARYSSGYGADVIDLSSPPQSPHRSGGRSSGGGNANANDGGQKQLIQIAEAPTSGTHIPYKVKPRKRRKLTAD
ncbi:uncharacterized protein LOC134535320 isoform X2 [Bacillus rossius redtenbacheri]|uniref:uncharacterized protein LOC134535320 isoform X2 n=1 Tax=Bacillus rossius redtenbacheri TaxID=93214 RepID=UPI002FDCF0D9